MCILFVAVRQHPEYPLLITANRDEFHNRPTQASAFWPEQPQILAGRDLQGGGTWMGVNRQGRIAALTNIRAPATFVADKPSRGHLVSNYLADTTPADYAQWLAQHRSDYNGYNLLFGDWQSLAVYNNHSNALTSLEPGIYGLSNADLHSPWPKTSQGVAALTAYCQRGDTDIETLFSLLRNDTQAEDAALPDTGVPKDWEKRLSSIFICSEEYGTRTSTLLLINRHQQLSWYERSFLPSGAVYNNVSQHFQISDYL